MAHAEIYPVSEGEGNLTSNTSNDFLAREIVWLPIYLPYEAAAIWSYKISGLHSVTLSEQLYFRC